MKRIFVVIALLILPIFMFGAAAKAADVQNFTIKSFRADYYLGRGPDNQSTLKTVEQIQAEFPNYDQNHGILRAIPKSYQDHTISLKIDSVTDSLGKPINYTTYDQNDNLVLKIGDANKFVQGIQTYEITYEQRNVALLFNDHDEFYWNVNGDQWQQPFGAITARVHVSKELTSQLQDRYECYFGRSGSTDASRCNKTRLQIEQSGETLYTFSATNGGVGENMTYVLAFQPGTFNVGPEIAQEQHAKKIKTAILAIAVIAPALLSCLYLYSRWRRFGRDPRGRGVIIPEYQPPKGLNVLTSDYIFLEKLDNKSITALIVELAIRRYVNIYEVVQKKRLQPDTTTYKLQLIKDPSDLKDEERDVLRMFFTGLRAGDQADLSNMRATLSSSVKILKIRLGINLTTAGFFRSDPNKATAKYASIGTAIFFVGFFIGYIGGPAILLAASICLSGLAFIIFSRYMPSRSESGAAVHDHMLGLRDYIKLAEADQLRFLQSPQGADKIQEGGLNPNDPQFRIKLFEGLLPYAMIFGLEKDWAKQFEDIYKAAPDWYSGNWAVFNTGYLASSIGSFSNVSAATFSAPHASGGSGFGGFAGGGGGGGGGGGW